MRSMWDARKIYYFFRDWLGDQACPSLEKHRIPKLVNEAARTLLMWIANDRSRGNIDPVLWKQLPAALKCFERCKEMLEALERSRTDRWGSLVRCRVWNTSEYAAFMKGGFHEVQQPHPLRTIPSPFHIDPERDVVLAFPRNKASPARLHGTMCFLEHRFKKAFSKEWQVLFDSDTSVLRLRRDDYETITRFVSP